MHMLICTNQISEMLEIEDTKIEIYARHDEKFTDFTDFYWFREICLLFDGVFKIS